MKYKYDLFISYKSEDANIVRGVVECLIAHGLHVWFAEYNIPLGVYNDDRQTYGRAYPTVQAEIDTTIDNSKYFLAFTNEAWIRSDYCKAESDRILGIVSRKNPRGRVAQVCVRHDANDEPSHDWGEPSLFIDYPSSNPEDYKNSERVHNIIEFLNQIRWFDTSLCPIPSMIRNEVVNLRFNIKLNIGPFNETENLLWSYTQSQRVPGEHYIFEGVIEQYAVHFIVTINPYQTALQDLAEHNRDESNDHEVYNSYFEFAENWLDYEGMKDRGAHLVFRENRRQFALTGILSSPDGSFCTWERRYAVLLLHNEKITGELDLIFSVKLPKDDRDSLQTLCKMMPVFDSIVYSIPEYEPQESLLSREGIRVILTKLVLTLLIVASYDYVSTQFISPFVHAFFAIAMGGSIMDFAMALQNSEIRRISDIFGMRLGPKWRIFPTYGRLIDQLWNITVGSIVSLILLFIDGILYGRVLVIILFLIGFAIFQQITSVWFWALLGAGVYMFGMVKIHSRDIPFLN